MWKTSFECCVGKGQTRTLPRVVKRLGPKDKKAVNLGKNELSRMELECREGGQGDPGVEKQAGYSLEGRGTLWAMA